MTLPSLRNDQCIAARVALKRVHDADARSAAEACARHSDDSMCQAPQLLADKRRFAAARASRKANAEREAKVEREARAKAGREAQAKAEREAQATAEREAQARAKDHLSGGTAEFPHREGSARDTALAVTTVPDTTAFGITLTMFVAGLVALAWRLLSASFRTFSLALRIGDPHSRCNVASNPRPNY